MKTGLVLQGGGMRGLYTSGVLDTFLDNNINFDYIIGVSAGACNAMSYLSKQKKRSFVVNTEYINDKRYLSFRNYIKTKSVFGMDFMFNVVPNQLNLFDYDAFYADKTDFVTGTTDIITGKSVYFSKDCYDNMDFTVLRASSSIPIFAPVVEYKDYLLLDGGTSDPIPVQKAIDDGCDVIIAVLTREREFVKEKEGFRKIYKRIFKKYPEMIKTMDTRHEIWTESMNKLIDWEKQGKALIIAPKQPLDAGRFEKKIEKLKALYDLGIKDTHEKIAEISEFINK